MANITTSVSNLVQGVSQQSPKVRFVGQCEEQINALSSVSDGLKKRPCTRVIASIADSVINPTDLVHFINRSEIERYAVVINATVARAFNLITGVEATINGVTGGAALPEYLKNSYARKTIKPMVLADTTFLLNTTKIPEMTSSLSPAANITNALVFIKQGDYQKKYELIFDGTTVVTYTSGDATLASNADTSIIARGLNDGITTYSPALNENIGHIAYGSTIILNKKSGGTFSVTSRDGLANTGIGVVFKTVDDISDLPVQSTNNFIVSVRGSIDSKEDDYYVTFKTNDNGYFGAGGWVESIGYSLSYKINETTMPYRLVNTALNTFELSSIPWADRIVGDNDSNPLPSFIGKPINNLFFFKNRLGLLTDDTVLFSEAGEFFSFFRTTVRTLLDSDPIDVSAASTTISKLSSAVAFQENLILFADRGQFVVKSGDTLTSKTISVTAVTNYDVDTSSEPMGLGSYVYFTFPRGNYLGIREFRLDATTSTYDSADITSQIPSYILSGETSKLISSSTENLICVHTQDGTSNTLYVYKFYWSGNEKVISSWSKFTFSMEIHGIEFMNSKLYIVGNKEGKAILTFINMEEQRTETDTLGNFSYHLDLLTKVTSGPTTSITLPYHVEQGDVVEAYDDKGFSIKINSVVGNTVYLTRPSTCFIGLRYPMEYTFSEPVFKQQGGPQGTPSGLTRFILRNGNVFFSDAAYFRVEVTPTARETTVMEYSPNILEVTRAGTMIFKDGVARFSIFTKAKDSVIKIINDSAFSANFQSAEFEANAHTRASRYS